MNRIFLVRPAAMSETMHEGIDAIRHISVHVEQSADMLNSYPTRLKHLAVDSSIQTEMKSTVGKRHL